MAARNLLASALPYEVEVTIKRLGMNLRRARLRRNITIAEVAGKIGTGPRAVMDAERGKPGTSISVYMALLWAYDLLQPFHNIADLRADKEGFALTNIDGRMRARAGKALDNDF